MKTRMVFTEPFAERWEQGPGIQGMYEHIERAARVCYKSDGKITRDENGKSTSARTFVDNLINNKKHLSIAEHGTVYLVIPRETSEVPWEFLSYTRVLMDSDKTYVTTNYRVLLEHEDFFVSVLEHPWQDFVVDQPAEGHMKRYTVHFITDRGTSAESNRHRTMSPMERSTRYVRYGDNFPVQAPIELGGAEEVQKALDQWGDPAGVLSAMNRYLIETGGAGEPIDYWLLANLTSEFCYNNLLRLGWQPQQARRVLPMDIETELVVTAFEDEWDAYLDKRLRGTTGKPHPDMLRLAEQINKALQR